LALDLNGSLPYCGAATDSAATITVSSVIFPFPVVKLLFLRRIVIFHVVDVHFRRALPFSSREFTFPAVK
jgi:hypothetical protein